TRTTSSTISTPRATRTTSTDWTTTRLSCKTTTSCNRSCRRSRRRQILQISVAFVMSSCHSAGAMTDGPFFGQGNRRTRGVFRNSSCPPPEDIAARAHQLFVADGEQLERLSDCWQRAEDELLDRAARRLPRWP